jgi:hypothetical protein
MRRNRICVFLAWTIAAASLTAQSLTSLSGVVTDPSGAVVPNASLEISESATGTKRQTTSDAGGRYSFSQVHPGTYQLTAKAAGFADVIVNHVELLVNSPGTLAITFEKVGSLSESVSVAADAVEVNTTDASIGNAIGERAVKQLPFEARNIVGLLALQPGVSFLGEPAPGAAPDYRSGSVNGGKSDQANVTLDGVDVNDQQNRYAFTSVLRVTLDSVQEFRTITSNSGADLGRTSGAQVALITKSGTNELHGAAYEYNRNTVTSANTFFNNSAGVERPKLIRNVFGAAVGGPIRTNRLFYFLNYEGRRDASDTPALSSVAGAAGTKVVPNATFRQGIFQYRRADGSVGTLTPDQIKTQVDPLGIGPDPAVLQILQQYPLPNDTTVGDGLNTGGYRFNAPTPLRWNTYIAKVDYQIDSAGNHRIFWRGNLQNDHFANGLPQFPGQPPSSVLLDNSKGLAAGYTAVLRPNLISTFRYGYTRQGTENTGIQSGPPVTFRDIEPLYATSTGLTRIIPVHQFTGDFAWTKGAHNVAFGGVMRFIRNNRVSFSHSWSDSLVSSAYLTSSGSDLVVPDAQDSTVYREQMVNLLGAITQLDAQYNYDIKGNLLPQGAGIAREFADNEYEMYVQDSWKVTRGLTLTAGLRLSLMPPVYEANNIQTSPNIPLSDWFNARGALAAEGQPQSLAPKISYQLANAPGGRPLYDFQKDAAPRLALAYSPQSASGLSKWLFGGPGKTAIRTGWGMYYDLFGQGLIQSYDANSLGFSTLLTPPPASSNPASSILTAPRFTGFYDIPTAFMSPAPPGGFPQTAPDVYGVTGGLDQRLKVPYSISIDFSIGREFSHGLYVQGAYVGRLSRHSLIRDDLAMPTNMTDQASGMTYFQAAQAMSKLGRANTSVSQVQKIPFFEDIFPGYADGTSTATQAIYQDYFVPNIGNESTALQQLDIAGCSPCSKFGPYAFYSSQYASLAAFRSRGSGSYHAMQWTVRKRFSEGVEFDLNYTWSKSIDLGSTIEADSNFNAGQIQNAWFPSQMKGVSDYDVTQLVSASWVAELPFGKGRKFLGSSAGLLDAVVGGWQLSGIWRQSSGLPTGVGNGFNWPTNWQITPSATQVGPVPSARTTKNAPAAQAGGTGGPNIWTDPVAALAAYDVSLPGVSGQRNGVRGDGYFSIDAGLGKRFTLFSLKDHPHTLQFRAEAFNITNTVRFDVGTINLTLGDPGNFGKYTDVLTRPRVMQFSARYEF